MLKKKTKFVKYGSEFSVAVLVPASIRQDSAFPFEETEDLEIEIKKDKLIVSKSKS